MTVFAGRLFRLILIGTILTVCGACSRVPDSYAWREEVRISDGRTFLVERSAKLKDVTPPGSAGISVITGSSARIIDTQLGDPTWSGDLVVTNLNINPATGRLTLIASTDWCPAWHRNGRPPSFLWAFELQQREWKPIAAPDEARNWPETLLPISPSLYDGKQGRFVSLAQKAELVRTIGEVAPLSPAQIAEAVASKGRDCLERFSP